jgi:hypothetical protein
VSDSLALLLITVPAVLAVVFFLSFLLRSLLAWWLGVDSLRRRVEALERQVRLSELRESGAVADLPEP